MPISVLAAYAVIGATAMLLTPDMDPVFDRIVRVYREALRMADLSVEKATLHGGYKTTSHLQAQLSGVGHLSLTRFAKFPLLVLQWFFLLGSQEFGLPPQIVKAQALMAVRPVMARADLTPADADRMPA